MQKLVDFYHNKGIDMVKLEWTLPNLAYVFPHKSTTAKFYPQTNSDMDLLEKIREDMVDGPSIVFSWKKWTNFFRDSTNFCKTIVGSDVSQLYLFSGCQSLPTLLCTRWQVASESGKMKSRQKKTMKLKTWSCHIFSESDHSVKWKVSTRRVHSEKLLHTVFMAFVDTGKL